MRHGKVQPMQRARGPTHATGTRMPACPPRRRRPCTTSCSTGSGWTRGPHLATATAISYLRVYNKHLRPHAGHRALERCESPGPVTEVLGQMASAGAGQQRATARARASRRRSAGVETGRMRANGVRRLYRDATRQFEYGTFASTLSRRRRSSPAQSAHGHNPVSRREMFRQKSSASADRDRSRATVALCQR